MLALGCTMLAWAGAARGGDVSCASAESMDGLMRAWTRDFTAQHPEAPVHLALHPKFSAEAFDALLRGEVQIAAFNRELFPGELERFRHKFGRDPLLVSVATGSRATKGGTHAIAIFVNEKNPLGRLSLAQLREIFSRGGTITTWGQLGLGADWAHRTIVLHGMTRRRASGDPPGIVNFLEQRVLAGRAWRDEVHEHTDLAHGPQALEQIVRAVAEDEAAIGYSGFAYERSGTKTLALAEAVAGPYFLGTTEDIERRDYPLARTIYLGVDATPSAATRAFLRHVLSATGQRVVNADAERFFPLNRATAEAAFERLK